MTEEDLRRKIRKLSEKMESLEKALATLSAPYMEIVSQIEQLERVSRGYFRLIDLYQRYGSISPDIIIPGLKDPISEEIIRILFDKEERNISQITRDLRGRRGKASRRIVRERLKSLEERDVVVCEKGKRGKKYRVSQSLIEKWSQVLGLTK